MESIEKYYRTYLDESKAIESFLSGYVTQMTPCVDALENLIHELHGMNCNDGRVISAHLGMVTSLVGRMENSIESLREGLESKCIRNVESPNPDNINLGASVETKVIQNVWKKGA